MTDGSDSPTNRTPPVSGVTVWFVTTLVGIGLGVALMYGILNLGAAIGVPYPDGFLGEVVFVSLMGVCAGLGFAVSQYTVVRVVGQYGR
jgi:hypothetical protein